MNVIAGLPKARAPVNLDEAIRAACERVEGITAEVFRSLLSPEDVADIEAGGIHPKTLHAYGLAFAVLGRGGSVRMTGIHCALQGRLGVDVEMRRSESGKDRARLSVGVGEVDELTLVSVAVFEKKARAIEGLATGAVYCEGRMRGLARMQHSAPGWRR